MLDGILNERLQEEARDEHRPGISVGGDFCLKTITESRFFNAKIGRRGIELDGKRSDHFMTVFEREPQIVRKFPDHIAGGRRMGGNLGSDAIERVEEKVGIELCAEQASFKTVRLDFCFRGTEPTVTGRHLSSNPKISEGPSEIDKPHQHREKDPPLGGIPFRQCPASGADENLDKAGLNDRCNERHKNRDHYGIRTKERRFLEAQVEKSEHAGEKKSERLSRESEPQSALKVLVHDVANQKRDDAEAEPDKEIDPPKRRAKKRMRLGRRGHRFIVRRKPDPVNAATSALDNFVRRSEIAWMIERRTLLKIGLGAMGLPLVRLSAASSGSQPLRFVFLTDVHSMLEREAPSKMNEIARRIADLDIDLVIGGGDFVDGGFTSTASAMEPKFAVLRSFLDRLGRPVEAVLGNHDLVGVKPADGSKPEADPARFFRETFGLSEVRRIFDRGGYRFVILDSVELLPGTNSYRGWIGAEQMAWLKMQIAATPDDVPFVLCSHIPFRSTFLQNKDGPVTALPPNLVVENANDVLALFAGRQLPLVLQGHLHVNESIRWNSRTFLTGGAVCGAWWKGDNWGTEAGFGVVEIDREKLAWDYFS